MLPKGMQSKEFCDVCFKEMEMYNHYLKSDESAAIVEYKCKCGYHISFAYFGGFVQVYKKAMEQSATGPVPYEPQYTQDIMEKEGKF